MKEYSYEVERSWGKQQHHQQPPPPPTTTTITAAAAAATTATTTTTTMNYPQRRAPPPPIPIPVEHNRQRQSRHRSALRDDAAMDADASSISETTSESGVSDLETSMTEFRCACCPYGYHLDTDFMKFLDDMYGPDVLRTLKKIERKRHDVRRRLINEQPTHSINVQTSTITTAAAANPSSFDQEILRETLLELDRIVERDIKDLEAECHRHAGQRSQSARSGNSAYHHQRSRSVDSRRHLRPPPRPPTSSSNVTSTAGMHSSSSNATEERRIYEERTQMERTITTRTHSAPRLNMPIIDTGSSLRRLNTTAGGPITMLYKIPPPPFTRSSSSSSISSETTLRVSSPEPDDRPNEPLKPLYISEITVPAKQIIRVPEPVKPTVITVTDKTEIERRNREIERLELERRTLLSEREVLLQEIDRYKHKPVVRISEEHISSSTIISNQHQQSTSQKPSTREVGMQHVIEDEKPPPLPPKQRQRDVAISHTTEYEDDEKQAEIVRRKLEEIKNFYTERIHFLEERIVDQEREIDRLNEPKKQRHVNTQCQPTMLDRALVTDTIRSVRDVALTCHLQPTLPGPVVRRDVNLQCNTHDLIKQRDVCMEAVPALPMKRDVAIGVSIGQTPDKHFRDVATHVNLDIKPPIRQRDVATMFMPEPILKSDRASNTQPVQTKDFATFANTIEQPKPPPKPITRQVATDTRNLIFSKDIACGSNEWKRPCHMSTDTLSLIDYHDRASGIDIPTELLSRHASTDTRTLISTRDNFSATPAPQQIVQFDAQTQFIPTVHHDASSNTPSPAEQRHVSIQAIEEQPIRKHSTTSTEHDIFHQLGHLRNSIVNTDVKRSTDRSTFTERQQSRDLAVNTEPKIMYSKNVGDFDVRQTDEKNEREFFEQQEITWNTLYGRRTPLHSQPKATIERGFQTDFRDTTHNVTHQVQTNQEREDRIEEQREEIVTFHSRPEPIVETTTEETYQTTFFTGNRTPIRTDTKPLDVLTTVRTETAEWNQSMAGTKPFSTTKKRPDSPEDLVEESYEVVSTLTEPHDSEFLMSSARPKTRKQRADIDISAIKGASSEDDSSYCEEWTVTEAKRKNDGQTVRTIIDRGGHHRYTIESNIAQTQGTTSNTTTSEQIHQTSERSRQSSAAQVHQHEETVQLSPSLIRKTTIYESHRSLGSGTGSLLPTTTFDVRSVSPKVETKQVEAEDADVEENYEITVSTIRNEENFLFDPNEPFELDEEMYIAFAIINESLYDKNADKKKVNNCLQLIQQEWFRVSSQKQVNARLVEGYLNSIKEHFSNFLLERIVNLQDANGNTALHYCVTNGHWNVVEMLLDTKVCDICLQNNAGYTAVMMAAVIDITSEQQRQVVRRLFRESGNVNVKTKQTNQTALMLAVQHGKIDLVELLLENGAAVNLQDSQGSTALMCSVEHESLPIAKLILNRPECDVNIADNEGQTAVSIATNKNRKDILVVLYAKMKERKGHHAALASKSRTTSSPSSNRLPVSERTSSTRRTFESSSTTNRRTTGSDASSASAAPVSKFRRV